MTPDHKDAYEVLRHSAAHLFAQAAKRLFPNLHLGVGPAIAEGFYYDTDNAEGQISNEDLPRIEAEMQKIVTENYPCIREEVTKEEALELFKDDPYKVELINEHAGAGLTVYRQGELWIFAVALMCHQQAVSKSSTCSMWRVLTGVVTATIT